MYEVEAKMEKLEAELQELRNPPCVITEPVDEVKELRYQLERASAIEQMMKQQLEKARCTTAKDQIAELQEELEMARAELQLVVSHNRQLEKELDEIRTTTCTLPGTR